VAINVPTKVAGFDYSELALITLGKIGGEKLAKPVIGNGTLKSGAIKIAAAFLLPMVVKNSIVNGVMKGVAIDGVEDVVLGFTRGGMDTQGVVRI